MFRSRKPDCHLKGNLSVQQASHTPFKHLKLQTDTSRLESINRLTERVDQKGPTRLTRLRSFTTLGNAIAMLSGYSRTARVGAREDGTREEKVGAGERKEWGGE